MTDHRKGLYEVLIRFDHNGYKGSHVIEADYFVGDDGVLIADKIAEAMPITQQQVGDLLGGETAGLIEQLEAARAAHLAAVVQAEATIAELRTPGQAAQIADAGAVFSN